MAEELIRRHNELVAPEDEVWWVGDVAMGDKTHSLPLVKQFNGIKFLIPGNHDVCWHGGKKNWRDWEVVYEEVGFTILREEYPGAGIPATLGPHSVTVSHFPPWTDERHGNRFAAWMPAFAETDFYIHGHTHQNAKRVGNSLHVGVDAWGYRPVSDVELIELIANGESDK